MNYNIEELIKEKVINQISDELSLLTIEEKDLYDVKYRYCQLYDFMERDYIDDIHDQISDTQYTELCSNPEEQFWYDTMLGDAHEDNYENLSKLIQIENPNEW